MRVADRRLTLPILPDGSGETKCRMRGVLTELRVPGRPLPVIVVDGGGGNQQEAKDPHHAVTGYSSQPPQSYPVSST